MFISRLAAKRRPSERDLNAEIYQCNLIDPSNRFKKYSINKIIEYIIDATKGRINISPVKFFQRITDDDVSKMVADYIYLGKNIDTVKIYSPWKRPEFGQRKESLKELSSRCNISSDALWGIYNSNKREFEDFIDNVKKFTDKHKIENNVNFKFLDKSFSFNLSVLLSKLHTSPGKYYKLFINTAVEQQLNENDTIKYLFLNKYNNKLNTIEKKIKINKQKYTFEQLAQVFNTTADEIKLFIIFDNINNDQLQIEPLINQALNILDENPTVNKYFINNTLMTINDIAQALKVSPQVVRQYRREQQDQFELFIEEKLKGRLKPGIRYITINNQDYTFAQIVEKFKAQGYNISLNDLNKRFKQILQLKNENYNKALKEMSKVIKEQLTGKVPFDLNSSSKEIKACSRLKRKLYS